MTPRPLRFRLEADTKSEGLPARDFKLTSQQVNSATDITPKLLTFLEALARHGGVSQTFELKKPMPSLRKYVSGEWKVANPQLPCLVCVQGHEKAAKDLNQWNGMQKPENVVTLRMIAQATHNTPALVALAEWLGVSATVGKPCPMFAKAIPDEGFVPIRGKRQPRTAAKKDDNCGAWYFTFPDSEPLLIPAAAKTCADRIAFALKRHPSSDVRLCSRPMMPEEAMEEFKNGHGHSIQQHLEAFGPRTAPLQLPEGWAKADVPVDWNHFLKQRGAIVSKDGLLQTNVTFQPLLSAAVRCLHNAICTDKTRKSVDIVRYQELRNALQCGEHRHHFLLPTNSSKTNFELCSLYQGMLVTMTLYGTRNHLPHFLASDLRHLQDTMIKNTDDYYYQFATETRDELPPTSLIAMQEKDDPPHKLTLCSDGNAVGKFDFRCIKATRTSIRHLDCTLDAALSETFKANDTLIKEFLTRAHALAKELPDLSQITTHTTVTLATVEAVLAWLAFDWKAVDKEERASFATAMQAFKQDMAGGDDYDEDDFTDDGEDSEEEQEEEPCVAPASSRRAAPKSGKRSDGPSSKKMRLW